MGGKKLAYCILLIVYLVSHTHIYSSASLSIAICVCGELEVIHTRDAHTVMHCVVYPVPCKGTINLEELSFNSFLIIHLLVSVIHAL